MPSLLPGSLSDHIDLAEAFDQFGRGLFPDDWSGSEVDPPKWDSVLPPEEAAMQNEADRLRSVLKSRGYRFDDDYIREIFRLDEHCDVWHEAWLTRDKHDSGNWADTVARLSHLIDALSESPAMQAPAVITLKAVYDRRQEALTEMLTLLVDGKLVGFRQNGHVRKKIEPDFWAGKALDIDIANSTASRFSPGLVVFHRTEFAKIIRQIVMPGGELTKHGAANAAEAELMRMMSDPEQPRLLKDDVFDDFKKRWSELSERDFDLRWKIACDRTKSGWDKPGRIPRLETNAA